MRDAWSAVVAAMSSWHQGKLFIERSMAISHDALHIIVGVLVWLAIALLARRPIASLRPWIWLLALIAWNETVDLWIEKWPEPGMQFGEGAKDILLTMLLPTVMLMAARARPDLFRQGARRRRWKW